MTDSMQLTESRVNFHQQHGIFENRSGANKNIQSTTFVNFSQPLCGSDNSSCVQETPKIRQSLRLTELKRK